jgi:tRNA nucleotidyltransferase (CCA-adding enzyme)
VLNQLSLNPLDSLSLNQPAAVLPIAADLSPVLSPQTWPFAMEWLPASACLVGGSVRDALLGRRGDYLDLDFVLPQGAVETAQAIARHYRAGFVLLDAERQIARVVFPQGTADFAQQVGPTLEADLLRRDFTVNAIAYNPHTDQLLDPLQGYADLQTRTIRMVSAGNLAEDPLRLLRAYRQAAQLGFGLEAETRATIRTLAPSLRKIAAERVQSELNYLLSTAKGTPWLERAWRDGVLQDWFPAASAAGLASLAQCDRAVVHIQEVWPDFSVAIKQRIRTGEQKTTAAAHSASLDPQACGTPRNWIFLAKLTCLLATHPATAEAELRRLKYSRNEIQAVGTILKTLPMLEAQSGLEAQLCPEANPESLHPTPNPLGLSRRAQFQFFQSVTTAFPAIALRLLAWGISLDHLAPLVHHFLTPGDPLAHPVPLLTGQDLMKGLDLAPGPQIGRLLAEIQLARAEDRIHTATEALAYARRLLQGIADR